MRCSHALPSPFHLPTHRVGLSKHVLFSGSHPTAKIPRFLERKTTTVSWDPNDRLAPLERNRFSIEAQPIEPHTPFPHLFQQAQEAYRQGRFVTTLKRVEQAASKVKPGSSAEGGILAMKGKTLVALGQYSEGIQALEEALVLLEKNGKTEFQKTPVYVALGQAYLGFANYEKASTYIDKVIAAYEKAFQHDYPGILDYLDTFETHHEYRPLKMLNRLLQGLEYRSSGSLMKVPPKLLPDEVILTLADALQLQGELFSHWEGLPCSDLTRAQLSLEQAKNLYEKVSTRFHPYELQTLNLLGDLAKQSHQSKTARTFYREVIRRFNQSNQQGSAMAYCQALLKRAELDRQEECYTQIPLLLTLADKVLGQILGPYKDQHPDFGRLLLQWGALKDRYSENPAWGSASAQADYQQAHALLKRTLGARHPEVCKLTSYLFQRITQQATEAPVFLLEAPALQNVRTLKPN